MAERIDHAAEAERFAAWADNPSLPPVNVTAISAMAQVHATLALVEQQRIANLIALLKPEDPRGYDVWPEISEGLGLPS